MRKRKILSHRVPALLLAFVLTGCGAADNTAADETEVFETVTESGEQESIAASSASFEESSSEASSEASSALEAVEEEAPPEEDDPRIAEILSQMTTRQKAAQMIISAFRTFDDGEGEINVTVLNPQLQNFISKNQFGGVILFGQNLESPEQTVQLVTDIQNANAEGGAFTQLFIAADQEGGQVTRLAGSTRMPGNMALAATGDTLLARQCGQVLGKELSACGINLDFAPDSDVNDNPENPIIGVRSFSDDPETVAELATAVIEGLHDEGVMSAVKHFPGHGNTQTDSHTGFPTVDKSLEDIRSCELVPFKAAAKTTDFVMTAHIRFPQVTEGKDETYTSLSTGEEVLLPATLSKTMITDILRGELGYEGVVITDSLEMAAVSKNFDPKDSARLAINAGVDMLLMPVIIAGPAGIQATEDYIDDIAEMAENGEIPMERLDEAVTRILRLKGRYGLLEAWEEPDTETLTAKAKEAVGSPENAEVEQQICREAVTLVKNDDALPITAGKKVVIAYHDKYQKNYVYSAIEKLKEDGLISSSDNITVISYKGRGASNAAADLSGAETAIILSSTDNYKLSDEGTYTGTAANYIDAFLASAGENGVKSLVLSTTLPYDLDRFSDADALMACYSDRAIPAAISAAFGAFEPTGQLPVKFIRES